MISVFILVLALGLITLLLGLPLFGFIIFYVLSFNRRAVVITESGENVDDGLIKTVNCRVRDTKEGEVIQFFKTQILEASKRFKSHLWTKHKEKNRFREAIILYEQSGNYRPTKAVWGARGVELRILDEDNRKFLIHREIIKGRSGADNKSYVIAVTAGCVALVLVALVSILALLYINNTNMHAIITETVTQVITG